MALRDLFIRFGIQIQGDEKLDALEKKLKKAKKEAEGLGDKLAGFAKVLVVGAIANKIKNFVQGNIDAADALKHQAEALGLTTDELQKYQYVASLAHVPTQQVAVAFRFFNRAVGEAVLGTKSATKVFGQLGIQVKDAHGKVKPTDELLFEFADKLQQIPDEATRTALAMRTLGRGGAALLPILQQGSAALRQQFKDIEELGGGYDKDFIEKAHEIDVQQKRLAMGWRSMGVALIKELLPFLKAWLDNSIKTVKALIDTAKHTLFLASGLRFLAAVGVAAAAALAIAWLPEIVIFTALAAAVWGAYLVFDDFYTFLKGGDSIIGRNLDKLGGKGTAGRVLKELTAAFDGIAKAFTSVKGGTDSLSKFFIDSIPSMIKWGGIATLYGIDVLDSLLMIIQKIVAYRSVSLLGLAFNSENAQRAKKEVDDLDAAYQKRHAAYQRGVLALDSITDPAKTKVAPPVPGLGRPATADEQDPGATLENRQRAPAQAPQSVSTVNHVQVTVQGVPGDPAATGREVAKGVQKGLASPDTTNRNTFDAVMAVQLGGA